MNLNENLTTCQAGARVHEITLGALNDTIENLLYLRFPEATPEWVTPSGGQGPHEPPEKPLQVYLSLEDTTQRKRKITRVLGASRHGVSEGRIIELVAVIGGDWRGERVEPLALVKTFADFETVSVQAAFLGYWLTEILVNGERPVALECFERLVERLGSRWEICTDLVARYFPAGVRIECEAEVVRVVDEYTGQAVWCHRGETGWGGYGAHVAAELEALLSKLGGGVLRTGSRRCA